MKSTLYSYLSNSKREGYNLKIAYNDLLESFRKGRVSYPRTDGIFHQPLKVLSSKVPSQTAYLINTAPKENRMNLGDVSLIQADNILLSEKLKLSTPASFMDDYYNMLIDDYEIESDKYVALKDFQIIKDLMYEQEEMKEINLANVLSESVSESFQIDKNDVSVNFTNM